MTEEISQDHQEQAEEHIPFTVASEPATEILWKNVYTEPTDCVRELVANAFDAYHGDPLLLTNLGVDVSLEGSRMLLTVRDHGGGMTRETMRQVLPCLFASTKRGSKRTIGRFGMGRFAALKWAYRVEVRSRAAGEASAGLAVFLRGSKESESKEMVFKGDNWPGPGTSVTVYLARDCPPELRGEAPLESYIKHTFFFVRGPIRLNGRAIIRGTGPLLEGGETEMRWPEIFRKPNDGDRPAPAFSTELSLPGAHVLICFPCRPLRRETLLSLYAEGVYVNRYPVSYRLQETVGSLVAFAANVSEVELTMDRRDVVRDPQTTRRLDEILIESLGRALTAFLHGDADGFETFCREHRAILLQLCLQEQRVRDAVLHKLPFYCLDGMWRTLPDAARKGNGLGHYVFAEQQNAAARVAAERSESTIILRDPDEAKIITNWAKAVSGARRWVHLDVTSAPPPNGEEVVLSGRATRMLRHLQLPKPSVATGTDSPYTLYLGPPRPRRPDVGAVRIVSDPADPRVCFLAAELMIGNSTDKVMQWTAEEFKVTDRSELSRDQRQRMHCQFYEPVLYVNTGTKLGARFAGLLRSPGERESRLCELLLAALVRIGEGTSQEQWPVYESDYQQVAGATEALALMLLEAGSESGGDEAGRKADHDPRPPDRRPPGPVKEQGARARRRAADGRRRR